MQFAAFCIGVIIRPSKLCVYPSFLVLYFASHAFYFVLNGVIWLSGFRFVVWDILWLWFFCVEFWIRF